MGKKWNSEKMEHVGKKLYFPNIQLKGVLNRLPPFKISLTKQIGS